MDSHVLKGVDLAEKLAQFDEHWSPRTVAEFNGHDVQRRNRCAASGPVTCSTWTRHFTRDRIPGS